MLTSPQISALGSGCGQACSQTTQNMQVVGETLAVSQISVLSIWVQALLLFFLSVPPRLMIRAAEYFRLQVLSAN